MITIKLTTSFPGFMQNRQTPGRKGIWGDCQFFVDQDIPEADFWVVYDNPQMMKQETLCRKGGTIYFGGEPPFVREYLPDFLKQFDAVITCQSVSHPKIIKSQQALPWHVGIVKNNGLIGNLQETNIHYDYDYFHNLGYFEKKNLISIIMSTKTMIPDHFQRLRFLEALKSHFGSRLDDFGVGVNPIQDKWDALAPYKYTISIENCAYPDYWTEKLSDAYLAWTYPIYYGCPNLGDYFPKEAYTAIDITHPEKAIRVIEDTISHPLSNAQMAAMAEARRRVLDEYNLFAVAAKICQEKSKLPSRKIHKTIRHEIHFRRSLMLRSRFRRAIQSCFRRMGFGTQSIHKENF